MARTTASVIGSEIKLALEAFHFNEIAMHELMHNPVVRDLVRRAILVEGAAKINASQPHRDGPNTGSIPGHGPAVRTGRLRGSITWRIGEDAFGPYADIGTAVFYGPMVELGTSRMEARPFLRPALEAARAPI